MRARRSPVHETGHTRTAHLEPTFASSFAFEQTSVRAGLLLFGLLLCLGLVAFLKSNVERGNPNDVAYSSLIRPSCGEPFDVVYTWVNGSDPQFEELAKRFSNDSYHSRRYKNRDELRYSLRSLEKYAPWVGQVYLVTNGQVPTWLNRSKVRVITHEEIYEFPDHLPTFSSPSIESNIHRIPGLSRRFLYFNDDIFLGAPIYPEDFISPQGIQRVYLTWDIPDCAPQCAESFLGDKYCDIACNVSSCDFDRGDCLGTSKKPSSALASSQALGDKLAEDDEYGEFNSEFVPLIFNADTGDETEITARKSILENDYCSQGCAISWIGDGICDASCRNELCGYDGGDCPKTSKALLPTYALHSLNETLKITRPSDRNPKFFAFLIKPNFNVTGGGNKISQVIHDQPKIIRSLLFVEKWDAVLGIVSSKGMDEHRIGLNHSLGIVNKAISASCALRVERLGNASVKSKGIEVPQERFINFSIRFDKGNLNISVPKEEMEDDFKDVHEDDVEDYASKVLSTHDEDEVAESVYAQTPLKSTTDQKKKSHAMRDMEERAFDAYGLGEKSIKKNPPIGHDNFGKSLVYTFHRLSSIFPKRTSLLRKVPAHMPHLIDREVIARLRSRLQSEFIKTSSHRFRSDEDIQFMYVYMAYLMAEAELPLKDKVIWSFLDVDGDGCLNTNEFRTLASNILSNDAFYGPTENDDAILLAGLEEDLDEIDEDEDEEMDAADSLPVLTDARLQSINNAIWKEAKEASLIPLVDSCLTLKVLRRAQRAYIAVSKNVQETMKRSRPTYEVVAEAAEHATFVTLKDRPSLVFRMLDALRARPTKFVCINDDTTSEQTIAQSESVDAAVREFFESFFPFKSSYESNDDDNSAEGDVSSLHKVVVEDPKINQGQQPPLPEENLATTRGMFASFLVVLVFGVSFLLWTVHRGTMRWWSFKSHGL